MSLHKKFSCSLCISTYNWPSALRLCLQSVMTQSVWPDEIIIADDGSGSETKALIEEFIAKLPVSVIHVWQPDEGFQLAKIRNKAFAKAKRDYIIQIDGDIVLHPKFIEDHKRIARANTFICGAKSLMTNGYSKKMIEQQQFQKPSFFSHQLSRKYNALRCWPLTLLNYFLQRGKKEYRYVIGANMAFWKKNVLTVNGYNETFKGWGKEDCELAVRLDKANVKIRFIKFAAIAYHLHHKVASLHNVPLNEVLLQEAVNNNIIFTPKGIKDYLLND